MKLFCLQAVLGTLGSRHFFVVMELLEGPLEGMRYAEVKMEKTSSSHMKVACLKSPVLLEIPAEIFSGWKGMTHI